jgi:hypothetical protein
MSNNYASNLLTANPGALPSFIDQARALYGDRASIRTHDLNFDFLLANNDIAQNSQTPFVRRVLLAAGAYAQGNEVRQSQRPRIEDGQNLPGNQLVSVHAVSARAYIGAPVGGDVTALAGIARDLERSIITIQNGGILRARLEMGTVIGFGGSDTFTTFGESAIPSARYDRQARQIVPFSFGQAQRVDVEHLHDRTTTWAGADDEWECLIRITLHSMIAEIN